VRFVSDFKEGEDVRTLDLETIIRILKEEIPDLDETKSFTVDEINKVLMGKGYTEAVIADALESETSGIVPFSGRDKEKASITIKGKNVYRLMFDSSVFEGS